MENNGIYISELALRVPKSTPVSMVNWCYTIHKYCVTLYMSNPIFQFQWKSLEPSCQRHQERHKSNYYYFQMLQADPSCPQTTHRATAIASLPFSWYNMRRRSRWSIRKGWRWSPWRSSDAFQTLGEVWCWDSSSRFERNTCPSVLDLWSISVRLNQSQVGLWGN